MQRAVPGADVGALDRGIEALLGQRDERPVFLRPAWLRAWLSEFGGSCEACFLACGNDGLLGVAPLMHTDDRLTFIGDGAICDFMDLLVDADRSYEAYARLWQEICAEEWSQLDLWGLMATPSAPQS